MTPRLPSSPADPSPLPPPQPRNRAGTRPPTDLRLVATQVKWVQERLAGWHAGGAAGPRAGQAAEKQAAKEIAK
jgi:hypothetical protein